MKRRDFLSIGVTAAALTNCRARLSRRRPATVVHPALWKFTFGAPETITPVLTVLVCGDGARLASVFEDDEGAPPALTEVRLSWNGQEGAVERVGEHPGPRYEITGWRRLGTSS